MPHRTFTAVFDAGYDSEANHRIAYDEAARRWFGKYAWLNFPDGVDAFLEAGAARAAA